MGSSPIDRTICKLQARAVGSGFFSSRLAAVVLATLLHKDILLNKIFVKELTPENQLNALRLNETDFRGSS